MPDDHAQDELAFLRDIEAYENSELLKDLLPKAYKLLLPSPRDPDVPNILSIEIDGATLPVFLHKAMSDFGHVAEPNFFDSLQEALKPSDEAALKLWLASGQNYLDLDFQMRRFLLRNLPNLMNRLLNIVTLMSVVFAIGQLFEAKERTVREKLYREVLTKLMGELEREIKVMLATRSSGRPPVLKEPGAPAIVWRVIKAAQDLMDKQKSVLGLKAVALVLKTSENTLAKKLSRTGHSWTSIRLRLRALPRTKIPAEFLSEDKN